MNEGIIIAKLIMGLSDDYMVRKDLLLASNNFHVNENTWKYGNEEKNKRQSYKRNLVLQKTKYVLNSSMMRYCNLENKT